MKTWLIMVLAVLLSGCGGRQVLRPQGGASLPPKSEVAATLPSAVEMMTPNDQALPKRSDDVLQRSEKRRDDPFDLPPKS